MNIIPQILQASSRKLIGLPMEMSLVQNQTAALWQSFMPRVNEIKNRMNTDLISLQVYPSDYFKEFQLTNPFVKWACVEVSDSEEIPVGLQSLDLETCQYAVFHYKGLNTDTSVFQYIYGVWLPSSGYQLADNPHFEVLGEKYKNNDANSEEEIWIPIK